MILPETVNTQINPEFKCLNHIVLETLFRPVELYNICPVKSDRRNEASLGILDIPVGVVNSKLIIPRRVVGYPVHDNMKAQLMSFCDKRLEIVKLSELWIHIEVILN